jgi:hypothetical protein
MIDSKHLNDLVRNTPGSNTTGNAISEINNSLGVNEKTKGKFSQCNCSVLEKFDMQFMFRLPVRELTGSK